MERECNRRSCRQQLRAGRFWDHIINSGKLHDINRATRTIPSCPYGGLMHVHESIWSPLKLGVALIRLMMMLTNVLYVVISLKQVGSDQVSSISGSHLTRMSKEGLLICVNHVNCTSLEQSAECTSHCLHTDLDRSAAMAAMIILEFAVVVPLAVVFVVVHVAFLCGMTSLPGSRPWFFIFCPSLLSSLSSLTFLQLVLPARLASIWMVGERKLWRRMFWYSIVPSRLPKGEELTRVKLGQTEKNNSDHVCKIVQNCFWAAVFILLIVLSFKALLFKLTFVHFAAVRWSGSWSLNEWIMILGFANQLIGCVNINQIEIHRLLMYQFGGADSRWTKRHCAAATQYVMLVADKIVTGKIGKQVWKFGHSRIGALAALWTLSAIDMQKLLLCPWRDERVKRTSSRRVGALELLWAGESHRQYISTLEEIYYLSKAQSTDKDFLRSKLRSAVELEQKRVARERDTLLQEAVGLRISHDAGSVAGSMLFQLAAEMQNIIEDLDRVQLSDSDSNSSSESDSDVSMGSDSDELSQSVQHGRFDW